MQLKIDNAVVYEGPPSPDALALYPNAEVVYTAFEAREQLRATIASQVGDVPTLLGTTADAAAILLDQIGRGFAGLANAQSLADVRTAAQPLANLLASFVTGVDGGTIKLPHMTKGGEAAAITEIAERCTGVADAMAAQSGS